MPRTCPHCNADAVEVVDDGKLEVCSECGAVVNEGVCFQSDTSTRNLPSTSYNNVNSFNKQPVKYKCGTWRVKEYYKNYRDVCYRMENRIRAQTERLRLPKDYFGQVVEMVKTVFPKGKTVQIKNLPRRRDVIVASCIYIVCRRNGVVISKRNVAEAGNCYVTDVVKCTRTLHNFFNFEFQDPDPEELVDAILSQCNVSDTAVKKLSLQLFHFCKDAMPIASKNKLIMMLGIVRICIENSKNCSISTAKFKEVCAMHTCTTLSVSRGFAPVKTELLKLAKEVPWIRSVKWSTLHQYIQEILSYYKQCKDHRKVDFKHSWEEKGEKIEAEKRKLIIEANRRIEKCHKECNTKPVSLSDDLILHKKCQLCSDNSISTTQETLSQDSSPSEHICCPHCCVKPTNCPNYQQTGMSGFCQLQRDGLMIEYLLRKGCSETQIMNGNPESIFCGEYYKSDLDGEREDLDDDDIPEDEIHKYIKTEVEKDNATVYSLLSKARSKEHKE